MKHLGTQTITTELLDSFLFDSAFANGAYSHSFGMESYIAWGLLKDSSDYQKWIRSYMLDVFAPSDGAVYVMACGLKHKRLSLLKLARAANASIMSAECRSGAINMARATLKNTEFMHNDLARWYHKITENENFVSPSVAFSVLSGNLIEKYAYASIKTLTINATRAIPLSYKKSSQLLYENLALAKEVAHKSNAIAQKSLEGGYFSLNNCDVELFANHQELDLAMFAHENLDFRLFMS